MASKRKVTDFWRVCPKCGERVYYEFDSYLQSALLKNRKCQQCAAHENSKIGAQKAKTKPRHKRLVPVHHGVCPICGISKVCKRPEQANKRCFACYKANSSRVTRRKINGVQGLMRPCPMCGAVITYGCEKSMLQAHEKQKLCMTCVNKLRHQQPGYTSTTMKNCMHASHSTIGTSKLERKIAPLLIKHGFEHFIFSKKNSHVKFGSYTPDFINRSTNTILEVFGTYWHADPRQYRFDNIMSKVSGQTAQQIWDKEKIRNDFYVSVGYRVIILWEKDIRLAFKDGTINDLIEQALNFT